MINVRRVLLTHPKLISVEGKRYSNLQHLCPESTIAKFIENKGAGVHHVAFAVEDGVANALAEAEGKEIRLIDKAPRKGAEGLKSS